MTATGPRHQPVPVTNEGRRLLEARREELERRLGDLQEAVDEPGRGEDEVHDQARVRAELDDVTAVLANAVSVDDEPDDPDVVELGDRVVVRFEDETEEAYVIVHAAEAAVDDDRISVGSPLGEALLGHRVGERIEVDVPGGAYHLTVVRADRGD